ncbi:hypothetical protein QNI19_17685 [Cytophagaceae bacterium DM2B3-1]|uniref:SMI1/KNR4 family protein n=1 Tax=Xanthocytophaga flava TaxID=3048013 RepID=A0ABT7CM02_9BACT|nr:hypothetical protein [Xanthocytophaga flavus]MDJ1494775.1 hypothetical protein [Xanthocytophaga flavus]
MNKSERKKFLQELQDKEEKQAALSEKRFMYEDIGWRGIGQKMLQIVFRPSFEDNKLWDIRKQGETYVLFESTFAEGERYILRPGYDLLECPSNELKSLVDTLKAIKITIGIPESDMFSLDGTSYEVCLYDHQQSIRLQWHNQPHEDWQEMALIVVKAIERFSSLQRKND